MLCKAPGFWTLIIFYVLYLSNIHRSREVPRYDPRMQSHTSSSRTPRNRQMEVGTLVIIIIIIIIIMEVGTLAFLMRMVRPTIS